MHSSLRRQDEGTLRFRAADHEQSHGTHGGGGGADHLREPCEVEIVTDSQYVKNGITKWVATGSGTAGALPTKKQY